ncbi:MAG: Hsp70 family protein [Cyanobacteria bacterium REEB459]|nr:Hsp70 family protein [Cyanobacteria bacterium REEB459]
MTLAIDFGTSNTVISRWNDLTKSPETIFLPGLSLSQANLPPLVPSLVYLEQASLEGALVGQVVRDRGLDIADDPRFFRNFKRGIGTPLQGFLPQIEGQAVSFEQVGGWFLQRLLTQVRALAPGEEDLVLTVPVDSFEAYRLWLEQLAVGLEFARVYLIDEPTAAALGYGLDQERTLLVLDFGGGTLDWSLVQRPQSPAQTAPGLRLGWRRQQLPHPPTPSPQVARVLAKAGVNLGGIDLDHWLMDYFKARGIAPSTLVQRLVERLKIKLSHNSTAQEVYFNDVTLETLDLRLSRQEFEAILSQNQFFDRLDQSLNQVLQQGRRQGVGPAEVEAVLLVGGSAQIPAVQDWVQRHFSPDRVKTHRPFLAVAEGALQIGRAHTLQDFLYHGYGVRYWDRRRNCHNWHLIIPPGQPYPMNQPVELILGASVEQQPSLELVIGELAEGGDQTEVYFEDGRLITRQRPQADRAVQPLNDQEGSRTIAQLTPPGFPGSDRLRVQFQVDGDRLLRITVEDLLTQATLVNRQAVVQLR